jgi:hypothetical protein
MRFRFFQRMSGSRVRLPDRPRKGAIFVTTVYTLLAFTTLALGMVVLSQVYLRVAGLRRNSCQLGYASENGIKSGFQHLREAVREISGPLLITDLCALDLMDSVRNGEVRILEEHLGLRFPVIIKETAEDVSWQSRTECQLESMVDGPGYVSAQFKLPIQSSGAIGVLPVKRESILDVRLGAAVGRLPLLLFPLLIDCGLDASQAETFTGENGISIRTSSHNLLAGALSSSAEPLIPRDATPLLEKGLKTRLFRPQDLSDAKLRFVLGLENIDAPVPDGVYLVQDSLGLGGIYVVGDVEEMVLAVEGSYQIVSFQLAAGAWTLKFSPSEGRTEFISPEGTAAFDLLPLGIIMASGKINSLGGGTLDASGKAALVQDREIPSLLQGAELTIVASDRIDISSHLIAEGLQWRDGIPYVKEEQTQLIIYSAGQEFQEEVGLEGGITVTDTAPLDIKIQASLTAQGLGFEIAGAGRTVNLLGSLQAVDYLSGGNHLNLYTCLNPADVRSGFSAVPQTARAVVFFPLFETLDWREY